MRLLLSIGVCAVLLGLYLDSLIPDIVVEHRLQVVVFSSLLLPIRYLEHTLEKYFGVSHYVWYRLPMVFTTIMDDGMVKVRHEDIDGVPIRVFTPYACATSSKSCPGIVYIHGGGWCTLSVDLYHFVMMDLARVSNSVVVAVGYRLAPEHPFPAGLTDCMDATEHVSKRSLQYGIDSNNLFIAGDSAGGNFAAVIDAADKDYKLKGSILIYPITQVATFNLPSYLTQSFGLVEAIMLPKFVSSYLNISAAVHHSTLAADGHVCKDSVSADVYSRYLGVEDMSEECSTTLYHQLKDRIFDHQVSPLFNEDLSKLSSTLVLLAEADVLRDEGLLYYESLKLNKVDVQKRIFSGAIHGFFSLMGPLVQPAHYWDAMADIAQFIKEKEIGS